MGHLAGSIVVGIYLYIAIARLEGIGQLLTIREVIIYKIRHDASTFMDALAVGQH